MFSLYVVCALLGTVVYIVMYNIRYDYCWKMDDGVSTQGFGNDFGMRFVKALGRSVLIQTNVWLIWAGSNTRTPRR